MKPAFTLFFTFLFYYVLLFGQSAPGVQLANEKFTQFYNLRDFTISADNQEMYFTVQSPFQEISQIAWMKKLNGIWTEPELVEFSDRFSYLEPFLSPNNNRLYFVSNKPISKDSTAAKDYDIWYVERANKEDKWSQPINLGAPVNTSYDEFYPTLSQNNNLYFTAVKPDGLGKDDIYFCKWLETGYVSPVLLDTTVNSAGYEFNAFVTQNEDFLLFTKYKTPDGFGSGDLYISSKMPDGRWGKALNLGNNINTEMMEYCPFYDEKNELLYFTSKRNTLKSMDFKDIGIMQNYIMQAENGLSKIYKIPFKIK